MKRSNVILAYLVLFSVKSFAYEYEISCENKKLTKFESFSVDQSTDECKAFIANGFLQCFDSRKENKSSEAMTLSTPNDHYYQSKESSRYSRKKIQAIIDAAIKAGNDPYLALSIVITENPPLVNPNKESQTAMYSERYGSIPLDGIAVADVMGCTRTQSGYNNNGVMIFQNGKDDLRRITVDPAGVEKRVCIINEFTAGEGSQFWIDHLPVSNPDNCCVKVKADAKWFGKPVAAADAQGGEDFLDNELKNKLLDAMAQKYMSTRFSVAQSRAALERLPEAKMAITAQAYNGYGKFGVSEGIANRCLQKMNMGVTPVYGAGTSEIMLNSLMNNSEIEGMVSESLKKNKKDHPVSYLCSSYGAGTHKVDGYVFTNLLQGYIGQRKSCPSYTNKVKKLSKFTKANLPVNPFSGSSESSGSNNELKKSNSTGTAN